MRLQMMGENVNKMFNFFTRIKCKQKKMQISTPIHNIIIIS
jgi:hypothetical protein